MGRPAIDRARARAALDEHEGLLQIVNTDIDGLLSAALLWERKRWPVVGFYDTERLWISSTVLTPEGKLPLEKVVFVDVDMCLPGTRSVSQHVVCRKAIDAETVEAFSRTLNPNLRAGISWENYTPKYPFGTFQWLYWLLGEEPPPPSAGLQTGLMWMPDGGFDSAQGPWAANCREWATELMPGSGLEPLFMARRVSEARQFVQDAMEWVVDGANARRRLWRNLQYVSSVRRGTSYEVLAAPNVPAERDEIQRMLQSLAGAFGWSTAALPNDWKVFRGEWASRPVSDPRMSTWTHSANRGEIVSCAFIDKRTFAYTRPRRTRGRNPADVDEPDLAEVLP